MSSLPTPTSSLQQPEDQQQHRPTISISSSSSTPNTTTNTNNNTSLDNSNNGSTTKNNHLLKSFFLKIFHKSSSNSTNSNELKRNQSFFDRFKRKNKKHLQDDENDLSPSAASSLSLNDLPDVIMVNDDDDDINSSHDNSINFYKFNSDNNLNLITKFQDETNTLESLSNYKTTNLISGSRDKIIRIRTNFFEEEMKLTKLEGHTSWIHCVYGGSDSYNNQSTLLESHIFSSQRSTTLNESDIYIWNIEYGNVIQKLRGHESTVYKMTQINSLLVSASQDSSVKLWDLKSNQLVGDLRGHNDWVKDVINPNLNNNLTSSFEILSCSMDGSIKLWDIRKMSTSTLSNDNSNNNSNNNSSNNNSSLIETIYQNDQIGFNCIYPHDSKYWYFGSNQSGKLHLYNYKEKQFKELNIDQDVTIDGIC